MTNDQTVVTAPDDYPWYRHAQDHSLEQGELLFGVPSLKIISNYEDMTKGNAEIDIILSDAIILTQSCDLQAGKVDQVVACPFFHIDELREDIKYLREKGAEKNVKIGRVESLYLLPPCQVDNLRLDHQIVNFRQVFTIPFALLEEHALGQEKRIRLCPPYREHLAQAFARFIMRVGFPNDFVV